VLSFGLGGLWVEVLNDTSQRLLPVDEVDVAEILAELRASAPRNGRAVRQRRTSSGCAK
jgi:hypothetical protein